MPRLFSGHVVQGDTPWWEPLLALVGEELIASFMWMFEVELEDGRRVDAYKHRWTRRYIHLAEDGATFVFVDRSRYREVDPRWLVDLVVREC